MWTASVLCVVLSVGHVAFGEAKAEAKAKINSPSNPFGFFNNLDGSGDSEDYWIDDKLDDDYYYYDDDDEGSGGPWWDVSRPKSKDELEVQLFDDRVRTERPSTDADIHFVDENNNSNMKFNKTELDLLYEYYNEDYSDEYDYDEEEELKKNKVEVMVDSPTEPEEEDAESSGSFFKLSYLYIMLASALIVSSIVLLLVFICRRSILERRRKNAEVAVMAGAKQPPIVNGSIQMSSSPIVKNYQKVPTSTLEFMKTHPSEKPLLP